jgi:hypothetical protein
MNIETLPFPAITTPEITRLPTVEEQMRGASEPPPFIGINTFEPALLRSSDLIPSHFFEEMKNNPPDGHIVGIGLGSIISTLDAFPEGVEPESLTIADVDITVALAGKIFIKNLKSSTDAEDFDKQMFHVSAGEYDAEIEKIIDADPELKKAYTAWQNEAIRKPRLVENLTNLGLGPRPIDIGHDDPYVSKVGTVNVRNEVKKHYKLLKKMAEEGKISISYADFTDPDFLNRVAQLPGFKDHRNLIFLTNAPDFMPPDRIKNIKTLDASSDAIVVTASKINGNYFTNYDGLDNFIAAKNNSMAA